MKYSKPVLNSKVKITDKFWKEKAEIVRTEVIPYQWNALNDKIENAEPSYSIRNLRLAAECIEKRKKGINTSTFPINEWHYTNGLKLFPIHSGILPTISLKRWRMKQSN